MNRILGLFVILNFLAGLSFATELPEFSTELQVSAKSGALPTAGDVLVLRILPPSSNDADGAVPEMAEQLKAGPVEWGTGRLLWWKPSAQGTGVIEVGVTTYSSGNFEINSIPFLKNGEKIFQSQKKTAQFSSVKGDGQNQPDDIYPPSSVSLPFWLVVVLAVVVLGAVLGGLYWFAKWNNRRRAALEKVKDTPRVLSPFESLEAVLKVLDARKLVAQQKFKSHYFGVSEAAKRFLSARYLFDAEESTTREIDRHLQGVGVSDQIRTAWVRVFEEMDVTKFTDQVPVEHDAQSLIDRVLTLAKQSGAQ